MRVTLAVLLLVLSMGCGGDDGVGDASLDASVDAESGCTRAADCDDGVFCNGVEVCDTSDPAADERGCVVASAPPCLEGQVCDEEAAACLSDCEREPDADGDGHRARECGGDDCDDSDPLRYPGNVEVCDTAAHDEDCDPATFGVRDSDSDGFPDGACCNLDGETMRCGDDCDDSRSAVHPGQAESCDGFDNDCDGATDEGVQRTFFPDRDGDGFGDGESEPVRACTPPDAMHVENETDCDDTDRSRNPATSELCDGIDNDCDGATDEGGSRLFYRDVDGDGYGDPDTVVSLDSCEAPAGYVAVGNDCDDTDAAKNPGAAELCNRIDDNCSLPDTFAGLADPAEDVDGDGHAPAGTALCTGGPLPADDCDDTDASIYVGAQEQCNEVDHDCDGTVDEDADAWCGPGQVCNASRRCERRSGLAAGGNHSCSVEGGQVYCWGYNNSGQLGDGTVGGVAGPRMVVGLIGAVEVVTGFGHTCARLDTGRVYCWGDNYYGTLGDGTTTSSPTPVEVVGLTDAVGLAAGRYHTCAWRATGQLVCWGDNRSGQLGDGTTTNRSMPTAVSLPAAVLEATAGGQYTCARLETGRVYCWGENVSGQLGDGTLFPSDTPREVAMLGDEALQIAAGVRSTCALTRPGRVYCWGENGSGQLGDGTTVARTVPVEVVRLPGAVAEVVVGEDHACARLESGRVTCWGHASLGKLGVPWFPSPAPGVKVEVVGLSDAVALAAGDQHTCARRSSGEVVCWGYNNYGQLGDGGDRAPQPVLGLGGAVGVSAGGGTPARCQRTAWCAAGGATTTASSGTGRALSLRARARWR